MIRYTSNLRPEYGAELERLMFFNPGQQTALATIMDSVEKFGQPSLYIDQDRLRIKVEKLHDVQTLFVLDDDTLAAVLVYSRISVESLIVIHIAVDYEYSSQGNRSDKMLVMRMLNQLRQCACHIKGIENIRLMNSSSEFIVYPV
ncbi:MAG: hypothetical protein H8E21_05090 [Gammaproteobacteria bacterium]|nr:hypothetical protein [Gammaproteobacteria bacterium]MBL7000548.1 hypothetical protein [Gammaproteobacteria bacterium]